MTARLDALAGWFAGRGRVLVALSGGVDSALVAYAAHRSLGSLATAVTADYRALSREELESAEAVCSEIGISRRVLSYDELENEGFARNGPDRCLHCRGELGGRLAAMARRLGGVVVDGTNLDDLGDYRPGISAMRASGVLSPLVETGMTKADVREAARSAGLSVHDRPSNSCLASRIPWGTRVTAERLARIEAGEMIVRRHAGARQVRVRDMGGTARIEVDAGSIPSLRAAMGPISEGLRAVGFGRSEVDGRGYRQGGTNVVAD
ncbi:MAG: ATP-dependent sacrificial sulfur transferase LarE [Nitrosopumilus sp.]|nr:ATP-dependent sacrificial sulfur transferase LarE [Nitrosopumilus sp.]CAI9832745.1 ATP-utilizing enzyme of the PP-loop superfamily [Nitrosopumilaceae archaeon]MDA7941835.1 ATP-dependent sacrificial sulfur transferase LarE [Nitrosopumilus sp.]MDA7943429.1 ATP-dependent sacrificial sulfur transferase LarE [Nitrosopumilus sp.]MDA7945396.1 ATP-dependent sacrificial sulfur transferase LarE [Nitrosopumilus sp.]